MSRSPSNQPNLVAHQVVKGILERGQLTPKEYLIISSALISNMKLNQEMKQEINRILDALQTGRLKLVDS
ncbi:MULTISPECIES: hypothetical protein [unclassified Roseofilum]|uniref:hypothetical protein n=1 Tax=unclassified Roseofilum TaxID=2620099 RepID=UPI001B0F5ED2|nr:MULTISPECIES: hypothetical protein [unclassified Roseofilum]MBP0008137.1 hypothetical protein [Roseofilum sp. Belize Diploria]MBP0032626.1 hypothetical protein [Roseofilum sp. Belize BBD 4]